MRLILLAMLMALPAAVCSAASVGVAYIGQSGQAERTLAGFNERMREIAPEMTIETRAGLADEDALARTVESMSLRHDGLILVRSNASQWLAANRTTVPTFIAGGNHPPTLGSVLNMDAPEGNVTGVTYFLDHATVMEIFVALAPQALTWELFTQAGHPAAPIDSEGVAEACVAVFISCASTELSAARDLAPAIRASKAEAFLIGNQAPLYDDPALFAEALEAAGDRPIFSLNQKPACRRAITSSAGCWPSRSWRCCATVSRSP